MPEYLAPGVYVEETSFRPKTIEGVSTSTAGFVGPTRYGPTEGEPELLTSFADFERYYGGLEQLVFSDAAGNALEARHNFVAHAVRAFFEEGGKRCYVTRVYERPTGLTVAAPPVEAVEADVEKPWEVGYAFSSNWTLSSDWALTSPPDSRIELVARFPGRAGNMRITFLPRLSDNLLSRDRLAGGRPQVQRIQEHDTVLRYRRGSPDTNLAVYDVVRVDDTLRLQGEAGAPVEISALDPDTESIFLLTVNVSIERPTFRLTRPQERYLPPEILEGFKLHPRSADTLLAYFKMVHASQRLHLTAPFAIVPGDGIDTGREMMNALFAPTVLEALQGELDESLLNLPRPVPSPPEEPPQPYQVYRLENGSDGAVVSADAYRGQSLESVKSGFGALEAIEDISIVAAPGYSYGYRSETASRIETIQAHLINHAERMKYRIAVLDAPDNQSLSEVREFRGKIDSKYAALYYPWVRVLDPITGQDIHLPPSGFISGIYARNDVLHGVQKAPANEVVRLAVGFEFMINHAQQEVLNPEGINCFRFFEGRGRLLWGARTATSDGEWKYVNLRRFFAYLERSIDRGTQIFVFESNGERLWENVRRTIEDFLYSEWKAGRLMGVTTEEAYFVRCDRSTMTQNDIDNGRLICLIGVAPLRPAEFVIFRIGQKLLETRG